MREIEAAARRGRMTPALRTRFQAVAALLRDERARVRVGTDISGRAATEQLRRLDGLAAILATTAVQDAGLLALLAEDAALSDAARSLKRDMLRAGGVEPELEDVAASESLPAPAAGESRVVPRSVVSRNC